MALYILSDKDVDNFKQALSEKKEINPYTLYHNNKLNIFCSDLICYTLPVILKNNSVYISDEVTKDTLEDYSYNFSESDIYDILENLKAINKKLITPQIFEG